jgi:hypothetical protein
LDRSGDSVFCKLIGAAKAGWNRAARSALTLGSFNYEHWNLVYEKLLLTYKLELFVRLRLSVQYYSSDLEDI